MQNTTWRVVGIETSCDETGVAIYDSDQGLLAHRLYSQIDLHRNFGGVVPELASRDHIRKTLPLIRECLQQSGCKAEDINGLAYTQGPGLAGALMVGASIGRSLAYAWGIPSVGVHHMEGHLLAPLLEETPPALPFVALLVSGGHTQLIRVERIGSYELLGESLDDAAGEAFDKTAKLLGLGYPGGAALSALAEQGDPQRFTFPRPMVNRPGLDFSFSGLKTHAMTTLREAGDDPQTRADIARAFVDATVDTLLIKCRRALQHTGIRTLIAAGGVSANRQLREALSDWAEQANIAVHYPRPEFCTDNGAMIAYAGYLRLAAGQQQQLAFEVRPRWSLDCLPPLAAE